MCCSTVERSNHEDFTLVYLKYTYAAFPPFVLPTEMQSFGGPPFLPRHPFGTQLAPCFPRVGLAVPGFDDEREMEIGFLDGGALQGQILSSPEKR